MSKYTSCKQAKSTVYDIKQTFLGAQPLFDPTITYTALFVKPDAVMDLKFSFLFGDVYFVPESQWLPFVAALFTGCAATVLFSHFFILILVILHNKRKRIRVNREMKSQNLLKAVAYNCSLSLLLAVPFCLANISLSSFHNNLYTVLNYVKDFRINLFDTHELVFDCEKINAYLSHSHTMFRVYIFASISIGCCWLLYQPLLFLNVLLTDCKIRQIFCNIAVVKYLSEVLRTISQKIAHNFLAFYEVFKKINRKFNQNFAVSQNNLPNPAIPEIQLLSYRGFSK